MRVMKVIVGLVLVIGVVSGCATSMPLGVLHTELKLPVAVTDNSGKAAKVGRAQCTSMLGLVATGDASIDAAKRNAWNIELFESVMPNEAPISHAKVFSKDNGDEVYIGSANLTLASMEKTIEIGVFLKGKETQPINEFLSMVKTISQKRWP